ncbi:50S ribosomal protein L9 [Moheibacter sp. BDHS18]|uniref:Large ribosomal subunit protein bL9 n=1 Tax=Moheibacter lacus TaxID=2745851 RepID=A0A838ZTH1_9FLAO|nr:50S ribosomal protein L9 [Moheibacter lacus]
MDIILKQDVENLGFEFEIVSVKPGYARNFLIPNGKAVIATAKQREELAKVLETRKAEEASLIAAANEKSAKLNGLEVKIDAKVGSGDKLFGSVNNGDLAEALNKAGVEIEKKNIKIPGNTIKRLGKNVAKIRFHREVEVDFEFEIVADQESIQRAEAAAKAKAEVARMDAERAANANKTDDSGFNYDNPLFEKKPKVEEVVEAKVEEVSTETETPSEEA